MSTDYRIPLAIIVLLATSASYAATKTYIGTLAGTAEVPPNGLTWVLHQGIQSRRDPP